MEAIQFGNIGVCVDDFTKESLYEFLESHYLSELLDARYFRKGFNQGMYLQSENLGPYKEETTLNIHEGYVRYVTDMDTSLLILRTGILNADAANSLVDELYSQGLIKPRNTLIRRDISNIHSFRHTFCR